MVSHASPAPAEQVVRRFIQAIVDRVPVDELAAFFHPDVEQVEFPNRIVPGGARRDLAALLEGATRGRTVLTSERYDVERIVVAGDTAVAELRWQGTTAIAIGALAAGSVLTAHICQIVELEDGRIRRLRNYDCYEPW